MELHLEDGDLVAIGGVDVTHLPEHKRANYIGRVFRDHMMGSAATMQIEGNLALAVRRGQRQALILLMAALKRPSLLFLDEHTAALDPKTAAKVLDVAERVVRRNKRTTLMITHNMRDAIVHGNRLIMMYEGRIVLDISGEDKKKLAVEDLLAKFGQTTGSDRRTTSCFSADIAIKSAEAYGGAAGCAPVLRLCRTGEGLVCV